MQAHYELFQARSATLLEDPAAARALLARAEAARNEHIPIFAPVDEHNFPKMAQSHAMLRAAEAVLAHHEGSKRGVKQDPGGKQSGCWKCGLQGGVAGLKVCKACSVARYCCRSCQETDWIRHKPVCRDICSSAASNHQ